MKKLFRQKSFWVVLAIVIIIVGGIWYKLSRGGSATEYTTEQVKLGKLVQTVAATGAVGSANEIDLNFKSSGRLVYLSVDEGSRVKVGQILARIDSAWIAAQVEQYRAGVLAAQADLAKVRAGFSAEDIGVTQEKTTKAENDLANLLVERDNELKTLREKDANALNNSIFTANVAIKTAFDHLFDGTTANGILFFDTSLEVRTEDEYNKVKKDLDNAAGIVDTATVAGDYNSLISVADEVGGVLADLGSFLNDAYNLTNKIIYTSDYTVAKKNTIMSDLDTQRSTNQTSLTSLQTAKSNLINTANSYASQVQAAENNLSISRAELNVKKAGPKDFEISAAEAKVAQALAQLNQALANWNDYSIVAPIDGTVTKVNFSLGEQTNLTEPTVKMLSTEKYEIKIDIPESDVAKIKLGDEAVIELDAFGVDHLFAGKVAFVDPAQTVIQDVTYYRTTISLESNSFTVNIKPGMTADVTIKTAAKDNVLYIPQRAVKIRETVLGEAPEKYVEVLIDENLEERKVEIGLRGDNGLVEIVSGLNENDQVVTFKKENK